METEAKARWKLGVFKGASLPLLPHVHLESWRDIRADPQICNCQMELRFGASCSRGCICHGKRCAKAEPTAALQHVPHRKLTGTQSRSVPQFQRLLPQKGLCAISLACPLCAAPEGEITPA